MWTTLLSEGIFFLGGGAIPPITQIGKWKKKGRPDTLGPQNMQEPQNDTQDTTTSTRGSPLKAYGIREHAVMLDTFTANCRDLSFSELLLINITTIIILSLLSSLYTNSISPDGRILFELNQHCHISQSTASSLFQWCTNLIQKFPGNCSFRGYPVAKNKHHCKHSPFFSNAKFTTKHGQTGITRLPT